ncbi:uncharacterized protein [Malus domestica]|uniref:uncharacterized protein isoform X1 n=2 Tax=Malus domestica TaxID=3750 RepID=UPI0039749F97
MGVRLADIHLFQTLRKAGALCTGGWLASKELLTGMRIGISLKTKESAKSAPNGPFASSIVGNPSTEFSDSNYGRSTGTEASPKNLKVMITGVLMIIEVLGLCFLATRVSMNQHGGHLTLMMTLTWCGVSMQLVPPRIWIRRVIRIPTFLTLGSSASTLSGLGHHKDVAFPRRAALLLSMILFPAHHYQPSIQLLAH